MSTRVGLYRAAGLFAPRVKALVGGEERTLAGGAGREALSDFTSWAPTGVIDAASNTGDVAQYLCEQGYSGDEIYERIKKAFSYELPYDIVSQGLFGTFMGGRGVRAALSENIEGYDSVRLGMFLCRCVALRMMARLLLCHCL